jgi:hypothetical protein
MSTDDFHRENTLFTIISAKKAVMARIFIKSSEKFERKPPAEVKVIV